MVTTVPCISKVPDPKDDGVGLDSSLDKKVTTDIPTTHMMEASGSGSGNQGSSSEKSKSSGIHTIKGEGVDEDLRRQEWWLKKEATRIGEKRARLDAGMQKAADLEQDAEERLKTVEKPSVEADQLEELRSRSHTLYQNFWPMLKSIDNDLEWLKEWDEERKTKEQDDLKKYLEKVKEQDELESDSDVDWIDKDKQKRRFDWDKKAYIEQKKTKDSIEQKKTKDSDE